jgi:Transcriptional regulators
MCNEFIPISQVVAGRIKDMIFLEKKYLPNDRLPNEYDLSAQLGVSRTSLREAIKILAANGILTIKRGSGTFVSSTPDNPNDPFGMAYLDDKKKLVKHWFEFRLILEPPNARLAANNGTDEEIKAISDSAIRIVELIKCGKSIVDEDQLFHASIATATHNDIIKLTMPSLVTAVKDAIITSTKIGTSQQSMENVLTYHTAIADFIAMRDDYGAEIAMRYHILRGLKDLEKA